MTHAQAPWFPIIISDRCDGCAKTGNPRCIEYCPKGVFIFQNGKAVVAYPTKCINGCTACAPLCHNRAIVFPQRNAAYGQAKKEDKSIIRKTTCPKCGKKYWTNRETDICLDCEGP